eukprot:scaffold83289_cov51-Phaeocystis_antarctica.AAC.2
MAARKNTGASHGSGPGGGPSVQRRSAEVCCWLQTRAAAECERQTVRRPSDVRDLARPADHRSAHARQQSRPLAVQSHEGRNARFVAGPAAHEHPDRIGQPPQGVVGEEIRLRAARMTLRSFRASKAPLAHAAASDDLCSVDAARTPSRRRRRSTGSASRPPSCVRG